MQKSTSHPPTMHIQALRPPSGGGLNSGFPDVSGVAESRSVTEEDAFSSSMMSTIGCLISSATFAFATSMSCNEILAKIEKEDESQM